MQKAFELLKETFQEWQESKASRLSAALAYYTMLSLAPLLLIIVSIAGFVFGEDAAAGAIQEQIGGLVGSSSAGLIEDAIQQADKPSAGIIASLIGVATLVFGATGVFAQLQDSMNTVWEVQPRPDLGVKGTVKKRFTGLTMVLGIAFLLLVSLVVSAALSGLNKYMSGTLPGGETLWWAVNIVVSLGIVTLLFAMIFKFLPDVEIDWGDVWIGAFVTALLFTLGKFLLGTYIGSSSVGSVYGAAGSLAILLVWVYYSGLILFFGAEFTQVYARHYGSRIVPDEDAVPLTERARAREGIPRQEHVERKHRQHPREQDDHQEELAALLASPDTIDDSGKRTTRASTPTRQRYSPIAGFLAGLLVGARRASSEKDKHRS